MRHSVQEGSRTYVFEDAPVAPENLQPGDIVIYPDWATMYAGNGMLLNANALTGTVTETPMEYAGEPVGIAPLLASTASDKLDSYLQRPRYRGRWTAKETTQGWG